MIINRFLFLLILVSYIDSIVWADEVIQKRDRINSVKDVISTVTKMKDKNISIVDNFKHMFKDAKVSGQIRAIYAGYDQKEKGVGDSYATALGGILKYELAKYNGFSAGVAMYASYDISMLSGDKQKHNDELSSSKGDYTTVGEAYLDYSYHDFNFRAGRQNLDTPLADSDDIRMIQNSFEAYVATYKYNGFDFMAGRINSWQGIDNELDNGWSSAGKYGTNFCGLSYNDKYKLNLWYYNLTKAVNSFYFDTGIDYAFNEHFTIHSMVQFLKENELSNSGYNADIYGATIEFIFDGLGVNIAYNATDTRDKRETFSGTGGGALYTSMDTMILDTIATDRKAQAIVSGISYNYNNLNFLYAYGSFMGDKDSNGIKAYVVEQDIGFEYNINKEFIISAIYVLEDDRANHQKTENDWNRAQFMIHYNF